jgi:hypothetical protein
VIDGWADDAYQSHRSSDQQPVAHGHMLRRVEHRSGEQENQLEEDVPCGDMALGLRRRQR